MLNIFSSNSELLSNKTILITGSSRGIGFSLGKFFAENTKAKVVFSSSKPLEEHILKSNFPTDFINNVNTFFYQIDVTNISSIDKNIKLILQEHKTIDILVNNAGIGIFKPLLNLSIEDFDLTFNTNIRSVFFLTKLLLPKMIENNSGLIVNISSVAHHERFKHSSIYGSSKSALTKFAEVVREETRKHNIKITNIFPGATLTEIWGEKDQEKFGKKMMQVDELANIIATNIIMGFQYNVAIEDIVIKPVSGNL